jgi:hypothetical protein
MSVKLASLFCPSPKRAKLVFGYDYDLDVSFHEECISMLLTDLGALGLPILPLMKKGRAFS